MEREQIYSSSSVSVNKCIIDPCCFGGAPQMEALASFETWVEYRFWPYHDLLSENLHFNKTSTVYYAHLKV